MFVLGDNSLGKVYAEIETVKLISKETSEDEDVSAVSMYVCKCLPTGS